MAWETRSRGGRYYTRSRRVNGRVVREYVGSGRVGELAARLDAQERAVRLAARDAERRGCFEAERSFGPVALLDVVSSRVVEDVLSAEGFHKRKGQWSRRRGVHGA